MKPEISEMAKTWQILRAVKNSCFFSLKPLLSNTVNCCHQVVHHWLNLSSAELS